MKKMLVSTLAALLLVLTFASTALAAAASSAGEAPITDPTVLVAHQAESGACFVAITRQNHAAALVDIPSRRADYAALDRLGTQLIAKCGALVSVRVVIPVTGRADQRFVEFKARQAESRIP